MYTINSAPLTKDSLPDDVLNVVYPIVDHAHQWSHDLLKLSHEGIFGGAQSSLPSQKPCGLRSTDLNWSVSRSRGGCGLVEWCSCDGVISENRERRQTGTCVRCTGVPQGMAGGTPSDCRGIHIRRVGAN